MFDSATITHLRSTIEEHFPDALRLLEQLVNIGSHSLDPEGVNRVGEMLWTEF